jgi:hypothetical protein
VRQLLPQLTPECKLLIVDNASDTPADEVLGHLLVGRPDLNVQIHRNRYNVGMCGNFMRCFELCDTEWLWILGDDEAPCPDAIARIFRQLASYPDCIFHNFVCPTLRKENRLQPREHAVVTAGAEDFIRRLDHFSCVQFIPLNVYRAASFTPYFSTGVNYAYSLHNFIAMVLLGLGDNRLACLSADVLIPDHGSVNKAWSRINLAIVSCTLLELPLKDEIRKCLADKIVGTFFRLKTTVTILLDEIRCNRRSADEVRYLFHQICARAYYYDTSLMTAFQIAIYRILFRYPAFSTPLRRVPVLNKMLFNEKK